VSININDGRYGVNALWQWYGKNVTYVVEYSHYPTVTIINIEIPRLYGYMSPGQQNEELLMNSGIVLYFKMPTAPIKTAEL